MPNPDKVWDRDAVLDLINSSNLATGKALYSLFQRQTASEQAAEATRDHNGVGFNGRDAEFLTSIAKRLPAYGYTLSPRQLPHVRRTIKKYTRQLLEIIEEKGGKVDYKKKVQAVAPELPLTPAHTIEDAPPPPTGRDASFGRF